MLDYSRLNEPQRAAVEHGEGPLLILAGAGSGKTSALTYRIARLIEDGVAPWRILAITFTNKAAGEMRERMEKLAGERASRAWVMTFHAACLRILRRDADKLGIATSFSIFDDNDQQNVIKAVLARLNLSEKEWPPRKARGIIGDAKNKMLTPDEWFAQSDRDWAAQQYADIYRLYEAELRRQDAMDFDDLLLRALELLAMHPPVLAAYQERFEYVLVDEYQDTNAAQYELVRLLAGSRRNLCVVGDDDQSIYGWRGADIRNILDFEKDYPDARVIKLEQNYRSTPTILEAANAVIANNIDRKQKRLWTENDDGPPVEIAQVDSEVAEAALIIERVREGVAQGGSYGDYAVLYRLNAQSRTLEEAMVRAGVPHKLVGGFRFYERAEVRDMLAYLRALANPLDDISLRRIINLPRRAIGDATVDALLAYAHERPCSLLEAAVAVDNVGLPNRALSAVKTFAEMMIELLALKELLSPLELFDAVIEKTAYRRWLEKQGEEEAETRLENLAELRGAVAQYEENVRSAAEERKAALPDDAPPSPDDGIALQPTLAGFLENVALVSDTDQLETGDHVSLMTLHSAKGLEFPCVFIAAAEDGIFPHSRAMDDERQMEEERRLCYVGLTRAMKQMTLIYANHRMLMGQSKDAIPSRFLQEIPRDLVKRSSVASAGTGMGAGRGRTGTQAGGGFSMPRYTPSVASSLTAQRATLPGAQPGDKVKHAMYGIGTVISLRGSGSDVVASIAFPGNGVKDMALSIAPLEKA